MPTARFYVYDHLQTGARGTLTADQARQIRSVLRLRPGARVTLFDGSGLEAIARIGTIQQRGAEYEVEAIDRPDREPRMSLTVGLALLRGERFEIAVQKLTELGVTTLTPLEADHCVVSFDVPASWEKRVDRLRRITREAAEQSERVRLLEIQPPTSLASFLEREGDAACVLVERDATVPVADIVLSTRLAIAVGPEGGWSERERELVANSGARTASLGRLILRAETAAIVAAGTLIQRAWAADTRLREEQSG